MRIDDRLGTFEGVRALAPAHAATLDAIRALIGDLHPDASETASVRERSIWWGWGGRKMKEGYVWVMPHSAHVNLGFFQGAVLPDPAGLLEGTGAMLRHVKITETTQLANPAIRTLIAAARDARRAALNL